MSVNFADMVATLGETTGLVALKNMHHRMIQDPVGQEILQLVQIYTFCKKYKYKLVYQFYIN